MDRTFKWFVIRFFIFHMYTHCINTFLLVLNFLTSWPLTCGFYLLLKNLCHNFWTVSVMAFISHMYISCDKTLLWGPNFLISCLELGIWPTFEKPLSTLLPYKDISVSPPHLFLYRSDVSLLWWIFLTLQDVTFFSQDYWWF